VNDTKFFFRPFGVATHLTHPQTPYKTQNASSNVKTTEEGMGIHSLARSILGVEGRAGALRWALGRVTSRSVIHMNLHKPNNKLVNA